MPKYSVYGTVVGSKYMGTYKAKNKIEAEKMAIENEGGVCLCNGCIRECEDPEITDLTVEEVE